MGERSGLCHGPGCGKQIFDWSPSQDFCTDACQLRWNADANGSPAGVVHSDGLYFIVTDPQGITDDSGVWQDIVRRHSWLYMHPTDARIRPRPDWPDPNVAAGEPREGPYPWARDYPGEFRHHDYQPPRDGWPGGDRFGWKRERVFTTRTFTDAERELAERWGVSLPVMDWQVRETWWDLPNRNLVRLATTPSVSFFDVDSPFGGTFSQEHHAARRYASARWERDPLADVRRRILNGEQPPTGEVETGGEALSRGIHEHHVHIDVRTKAPWWRRWFR